MFVHPIRLHRDLARTMLDNFKINIPAAVLEAIQYSFFSAKGRLVDGNHGSDFVSRPQQQLLPSLGGELLSASKLQTMAHQDRAAHLLSLLIYVVSNNYSSDSDTEKLMLKLIEAANSNSLVQSLRNGDDPAAEAFLQKLFWTAMRYDKCGIVQALLKEGFDPNQPVWDGNYKSPLGVALRYRSLRVAKIMVEHGADVNVACSQSQHNDVLPLKLAIRTRDVKLVETFITRGALLNSFYEKHNGSSALQDAVQIWNEPEDTSIPDLVRLLLKEQANVRYKNEIEGNCVLSAIPTRRPQPRIPGGDYILETVKLLVEAGAAVNSEGICSIGDLTTNLIISKKTALEKAAAIGHTELCLFLLDRGARLTKDVLFYAAYGGNKALVCTLLQRGVNTMSASRSDRTPLYAAVERNFPEIVKILIGKGANPNSPRNPKTMYHLTRHQVFSPLRAACEVGSAELVRLLLDAGANVNDSHPSCQSRQTKSILTVAAAKGNVDIVEMLLEAGAAQFANSGADDDPLHAAFSCGNTEIVKILSAAGFDFEEHCEDDDTPNRPTLLYCAFASKDPELVTFALNHSLDLKMAGVGWQNTLVVAVLYGDFKIVDRLLAMGADVNSFQAGLTLSQDVVSMTPLAAAATINDSKIFLRLLSAGANSDDSDALALLVENKSNPETIRAFLQTHRSCFGTLKRFFGGMALQSAIRMDNIEVFDLLLKEGIDLEGIAKHDRGNHSYPDHVCKKCDRRQRIEGETALGTTIRLWKRQNTRPFLDRLLDHGVSPNSLAHLDFGSRQGFAVQETAFVAAIRTGDQHLVELMMRAGVNLKAPATKKLTRTALQAAAEEGNAFLVNFLLDRGVSPSEAPAKNGGLTALQAAAINGHIPVAFLLLSRGADVNELPARWNGRTALEGAAEYGRIDMLSLMLDAGAHITDEDEQYTRATRFAYNKGHLAAVNLITRHHKRGCSSCVLGSLNPVSNAGAGSPAMTVLASEQGASDFALNEECLQETSLGRCGSQVTHQNDQSSVEARSHSVFEEDRFDFSNLSQDQMPNIDSGADFNLPYIPAFNSQIHSDDGMMDYLNYSPTLAS